MEIPPEEEGLHVINKVVEIWGAMYPHIGFLRDNRSDNRREDKDYESLSVRY